MGTATGHRKGLDLKGFHPEQRAIATGQEQRQLALYVRGEGPPLILLHELPGLSPQTFGLGACFAEQGFRVVMPLLFGRAGDRNMLSSGLRICLQRELRELVAGADGVLVRLIRSLAGQELERHRRQGGTAAGVAVVGMCFTGSMALALMLGANDLTSPVAAPVLAQPTSGYSAAALAAARQGRIRGPVLALRFERDWLCTARKIGALEAAFQACPAQGPGVIVHELEGSGHSTLTYDYKDAIRDLRSPTGERIDARAAVSRFIRAQLYPTQS